MEDLITRAEARKQGLSTYFDGEFCENFHMSERYVSTGKCVDCCKERNSEFLVSTESERAQKKISRKEVREAYRKARNEEIRMYNEDPNYRVPIDTTDPDELSTLPINKRSAIELGSKFYFTGKQCKFGHIEKRRVRDGACVACDAVNRRRDRAINPDRYRAMTHNRRMLKFINGGTHTEKDIIALYDEQSGKCNACDKCLVEYGYHVDHIMPLTLGGRNSKDNLQLLCPGCNLEKSDMTPSEWNAVLLFRKLEQEEMNEM